MIGRSGNPTLGDKTFEKTGHYGETERMTIEGTVNKSFITLAIFAWSGICDVVDVL